MFRFALACCFISLAVFIFPQNILAHENLNLPKASGPQVNEAMEQLSPLRFAPGSKLSYLMKIKESFTHFFKPSSAKKAEYDLRISGKRLKEAYILTNEKKTSKAAGSLKSYAKIVKRMTNELERARSQNQDIAGLIGTTADVLKYHEVLLAKIYFTPEEDPAYYEALVGAVESFKQAVVGIDQIQPGLIDRFESVRSQKPQSTEVNQEPPSSQATAAATPRIIIR